MAYYPVHQTAMPGEDLGTGVQPCATRARYPVHRSRKSGGEGVGTAQARRQSTVQGADPTVSKPPTIPDGLLHSLTHRDRPPRQRRLATTAQALTAVCAHPAWISVGGWKPRGLSRSP